MSRTMQFHRRCGDRVTLLYDNTTAVRNFVEFNHGLILSAEPLKDDVLFEVRIDRKVYVWNGSLEIGVTTLDPEYMELPATATKLRNTAWIMSGSSIFKDGVTLVNSYGPELRNLRESDCLGVMRTNKGELMFYINGRCLGVAANDMPPRVFAVIDLYGQCVQVTIMNSVGNMRPIMESSIDQVEEDGNNGDTLSSSEMDVAGATVRHTACVKENPEVVLPMTSEGACALVVQDRLRFHPRCGILVKLTANNKSAERARPLDDYNNGVVMTHRPLYENELFEIRIDRLVDKWSGSIEVGLTTHNPATIRFPSTMTNMDSGTIMMSGCKVLINGQGTCMEYGNFNLDELREGDTVGMMRKSNGKLHYFINGVDQGVATDKVEPQVWGVIDLYGMTVKVSIVDSGEDLDSNIHSLHTLDNAPDLPAPSCFRSGIDEDSLLFHTLRDSNVIIINDGKTAHRPNAFEFFNNGVVMTNRTLKTNELFQVRLDLVIPKWAGSIEIGVTQHSCDEIELPFKMSNAKSGTWAMTGEDVIRDGCTIIPQYVRNLNRLVVGDTVGVMRKDMGILHFYVNGVDQGPAAFNIPDHVFGVVDLYGRVAQATIVDCYSPLPIYSPESPLSSESNPTVYPEMCFHRVYGRNARLSRTRLTASRATVYSEFNDAVLFSSRPLRECEMFELRIEKMVDCWIGSLELGVTGIKPEDLEAGGGVGAIAGTATDLNWDTYILSGAAIMKDGECVRSGYPLDLDTLTIGTRVGMMWHADRSLHYYLDGMDQGKAWYVPHLNIYAVVDLYGQCTQVTILQNEERQFNYNGCTNSDNSLLTNPRNYLSPPPPYCFSEYCGENVALLHEYAFAKRVTVDPSGALVFSAGHLAVGEMFEVKVIGTNARYAGSLRIGVTDINILNALVNRCLPPSISHLPHYTAYIDGRYLKYTKPGIRRSLIRSVVPSFDWLRPSDRVGLKKTTDGRVLVYYNSEQLDVAFEHVPDKVYVVMEIYGSVTVIQAISKLVNVGTSVPQPTELSIECSKVVPTASCSTSVLVPALGSPPGVPGASTEGRSRRHPLPYTFHYVHGNNIKLCSSDTVALRTSGYKDGIAIVSQPLRRGHNFRFRVDKMGGDWSGSVTIGAIGVLPNDSLPASAISLEPPVWVVSSDLLNDNGVYINSRLAAPLEDVGVHSVLSIHFRFNSELVLDVDGKVLGAIAVVPRTFNHVFPVIDLYGQVYQVSALLHPYVVASGASVDLPIITENLREESLAEQEQPDEVDCTHDGNESDSGEETTKTIPKATSKDNLGDFYIEPEGPEPSVRAIEPQQSNFPDATAAGREAKHCLPKLSLHQSFILREYNVHADNNDEVNRSIQKSHSTHSLYHFSGNANLQNEMQECLRQTFANNANVDEEEEYQVPERFCDTNIQHNDMYPEANDVDNLDNEIMNALTLDAGNLPDLTEEQSSSLDESTLRDDLDSDSLTVENLRYLRRILTMELEPEDMQSDWEASGEGCEHLHLVLKFWSFLVMPFPDLRNAVTNWGKVQCYCSNCMPNADRVYADWVSIERAPLRDPTRRRFWHLDHGSAYFTQAEETTPGQGARPASMPLQPTTSIDIADIWFDEEGKPHYIVLALEIETEPEPTENDRLVAFWVFLKSHSAYYDEDPPMDALEDDD